MSLRGYGAGAGLISIVSPELVSPELQETGSLPVMARRRILGLLVALGSAMMLRGCGFFRGNSYRFKMTVEVETPHGLKTGSSVYDVRAYKTSDLLTGGSSSDSDLRGEALAVDLPDGKTLFALLKTVNTPGHDDLAYMSMRSLDPAFNYNRAESAQRIASGDGIQSPAEVAPSDYPMLVTFNDTNDPASVARIDPRNLAASLGAGVRLKSIMVEVTDDDVTISTRMRLDALGVREGQGLDRTLGVTANPTLAQQLSYADFARR